MLKPVPLPFAIPFTEVVRVIAGFVVGVATVPPSQLAETTEALVTVPPEVVAIQSSPVAFVLSATSIYPFDHTACLIGFVQS